MVGTQDDVENAMKDLEAFVQTNNRLPRRHVPGEDSLAKRFARLLTKRDQKEAGLSADILRRLTKLTELQLESAKLSRTEHTAELATDFRAEVIKLDVFMSKPPHRRPRRNIANADSKEAT